MKMQRLNDGFRVTFGRAELQRFCDRWPCSGLRQAREVVLDFSANGDTLHVGAPSCWLDGSNPEALTALISDARGFFFGRQPVPDYCDGAPGA